jgi:hypothetical protein
MPARKHRKHELDDLDELDLDKLRRDVAQLRAKAAAIRHRAALAGEARRLVREHVASTRCKPITATPTPERPDRRAVLVERHIAAAQERLGRQQRLAEELAADGQHAAATKAEILVTTMQQALDAMHEQHAAAAGEARSP